MFYFCHVLNTLFIHIQTSLNLDNMAKQNNCVKNSFKSFFLVQSRMVVGRRVRRRTRFLKSLLVEDGGNSGVR